MKRWKRASRGLIVATSVPFVVLAGARQASAQHVTPAMAVAMRGTSSADRTGCEDRARQAAAALEVLNAKLERARLSNNDTEMRAAVDALQKGLADVKARLGACRANATPPASAAAPPPAAPPAAGAMAGMDHATMNMNPAGAAATPTTIRQISGPAEAALQAFEDALQVGNRDVAVGWLAPEATITEVGATEGREAYAKEHLALDMAFLKSAKVALLDRQVHPGADSTHIVSTARVTGRAGEIPADVTVTEGALLKRTPQGWRIVSLEWSLEPVKRHPLSPGQAAREAGLRMRRDRSKHVITVYGLTATLAMALAEGSLQAAAQAAGAQPPQSTAPQPAGEDFINPDRPGLADGSTVIGEGRVQVETGLQEEFRRTGERRDQTLFVPTLVRVGLNRRWEARLEGNTLTRAGTRELDVSTHTAGFAPVSLGVKAGLQDAAGTRRPSLGVILRVFPVFGDSDFRPRHVTGDLRLAADWSVISKLSLNPNVGVARAEDDGGKAFTAALFALTFNYLPTSRLNPFVDLGLQAPEERKGRTSVTFDAGVAYIIGRNVQVDASIGQGAHGRTPPRPFLAAGISLRSGRLRRHR